MARPPRSPQPVREETVEYFVLDPAAKDIGGVDIPVDQKTGKRLDTVRMTASQAAFGLANGSLSTENPAKSKPAQQAVERNLGENPLEGQEKAKGKK